MVATTLETCQTLQQRGGWAEDVLDGKCDWPIAWRNTYSNAAYWLVAYLLLSVRPIVPAAWAMALALALLGLGSALYHGTKRGWANRCDVAGMYAVFGGLAVHALDPSHPMIPFLMVGGGAVLGYLFAFKLAAINLNAQMGLLLALASIRPMLHGGRWLAIGSLVVFGLAYEAWTLDRQRKLVGVWGHALWHVLTAAAIGLLFLAQGKI